MSSNQTLHYFQKAISDYDPVLSNKEKEVLLFRLRSKTLASISKKYKVSSERIRQIEAVALRKLCAKIRQMKLFT